MGTMLGALFHLQSVELQVAHVRRRLRTRKYAVSAQEQNIERSRNDLSQLQESALEKRKEADRLELDLKVKEEKVASLRQALNVAKTNKEYASILTQMNTIKADNARLEETTLKLLQDGDAVKAETEKIQAQIESEERRLEDLNETSAEEIRRLDGMLADLTANRAEAAAAVPSEALATFERIAANYGDEAMAMVEVHGKKPPYHYVCGGCFMGLSAEHTNALRVRDEIRQCDNCGRILYLESVAEKSADN